MKISLGILKWENKIGWRSIWNRKCFNVTTNKTIVISEYCFVNSHRLDTWWSWSWEPQFTQPVENLWKDLYCCVDCSSTYRRYQNFFSIFTLIVSQIDARSMTLSANRNLVSIMKHPFENQPKEFGNILSNILKRWRSIWWRQCRRYNLHCCCCRSFCRCRRGCRCGSCCLRCRCGNNGRSAIDIALGKEFIVTSEIARNIWIINYWFFPVFLLWNDF